MGTELLRWKAGRGRRLSSHRYYGCHYVAALPPILRFGWNNICIKYRVFVCGKCKSAFQAYSYRVKVRLGRQAQIDCDITQHTTPAPRHHHLFSVTAGDWAEQLHTRRARQLEKPQRRG